MHLSRTRTAAVIGALMEGRRFLTEHHWTRHKLVRQLPDGKLAFCARGALKHGPFSHMVEPVTVDGETLEPWSLFSDSMDALDRAASRIAGGSVYTEQFNDFIAPDKDAILSLYSSAIKELEDSLK